jgi:hypothetical protein
VLVLHEKELHFLLLGLWRMETAQMKSRFLVLCVIACLMAQMGDANVVLLGNNLTLSFDDIEASFCESCTPYNHLILSDQLLALDAT